MAFPVALTLLVVSLIANATQAFFYSPKRRKKPPVLTIGAEDLLHDLTRGPAVLRVEVIDAKNLFLRSPRT